MTDEWRRSVAGFDLGAYLGRVRYDGPVEPTEATLAALHRAHLLAIPFENLDIMLGRGVAVDMKSIQAKLVDGGRGGYCWEQNQLFGAALAEIGFTVDRLLGRVGRSTYRKPPPPGQERMSPRTHLVLRVGTPDRRGLWLSDVGFGSSPAGPLSLRRLRSSGPQDLDGWIYGVDPEDEESRTWLLQEFQGGEWVPVYRFEDAPVYPADIVVGNHYTSTHPDSWFTRTPVVARRAPDAITSLLGRALTVTARGHVKERRELDAAEWTAALRDEFGLEFPPEDLARLAASADGV